LTKSSASIRMDLARGHVALGEHVEALACLERAVRESPDVPGLLELIDELADIWSQERERVACRAAADALREFLLGRSYRSAAPAIPVAATPPVLAQPERAPARSEADAIAAFDAGHAEFRSVSAREDLEDSLPEVDADPELELDFEVPPEDEEPAESPIDMELAEADPVDDVLMAGFPPVIRRDATAAGEPEPPAEEELSFATPLPAARVEASGTPELAEAEPELDLEAELDAVLRRRLQAASVPAVRAVVAPAPGRTSAQRVADARVRELERWLVNLRERRTQREGAQA
jgi:hypothetical protein